MADQAADEPHAAVDLSAYQRVVIIKTDEIEGHVYRRGSTEHVDAATLAAMRAKGMVDTAQ